MIYDVIILIIGLLGLILGADFLVKGAMGIANNYKWSALWVGTVLVGFATTIPELIVSLIAVIKDHPHMAIGNALGSYVANIGMVLGLTALVKPMQINKKLLTRELPLLSIALILILVLISDYHLSVQDGIILLMALVTFIWLVSNKSSNIETVTMETEKTSIKTSYILFVFGSIILWAAGEALVHSASSLAKYFGMSDWVIGLTIVAVGTSLPELAASIVSAYKGHHDLAIGNVIGSNILGLLGVVAVPSIISPGFLPKTIVTQDITAMIIITIILWLTTLKKPGNLAKITRLEGLVMFLIFVLYLLITIK